MILSKNLTTFYSLSVITTNKYLIKFNKTLRKNAIEKVPIMKKKRMHHEVFFSLQTI